jgi:transcription termination/antitermination protein NusG
MQIDAQAPTMRIDALAPTNTGSRESLLVAEWYALQTRPRHEKAVKYSLESSGIETFLPVSPQIRSWSDRRKVVEFPLFPGYIFARTAWSMQARVRVFQTNGVIAFVGPRKEATPIPEQQIDAVRSLIGSQAECRPHPYLTVGQRVRIRNGALQGLEGILVRVAGDHTLVVSVDLIHRSVAFRLDGYELEGL